MYQCPHCPNEPPYAGASGLWYHMKRHHGAVTRPYNKSNKERANGSGGSPRKQPKVCVFCEIFVKIFVKIEKKNFLFWKAPSNIYISKFYKYSLTLMGYSFSFLRNTNNHVLKK